MSWLALKEKQLNERSNELSSKEKQLNERLINLKNLALKEKQLNKRSNELSSKEKQLNERLNELSSKEKQYGDQVKELKSKERQFEEQVKELESKEKRTEGREDGLKLKEKQLEGLELELKSREKQFQGEVKELESKRKHFEGQVKELESREKQFEGRVKVHESKEIKFEVRVKKFESKEKQFGVQEKELESKQKHFEGQVEELKSREKQLHGQVKELESKLKHFEDQVKEFKSKEKQFQGQVKELESKRKHVEGQVKELESKEKQFQGQLQELESIQKHIEGQVKELESKVKQFQGQVNELESIQKHFEGQVKEFDSKEKQFQGQVKELESKQKHFEGQVKELESKEKQFQGQVKEFDSKEKQFQGQVKEFESKQKHFEGQVKELESKEKLFVGQMKDLESKKNQFEGSSSQERQFEGQLRELDLKEKQYESFEEEKVLIKKSNILLHQVETEQLYFKDADSVSNSKDLQLLFNLLKKYELLCSQVSDVLHTSADPAKLVLDTIKGFHSPQLRQELIEYDANILRRICSSFLMDELKKSSPVTSLHVKQEAMKLASDWKVNIAAGDKDCLGVLDFLKFVATYEIGSSFNENELQNLLDIIAHHCQTPQALGCIEKLQDNQISPTIDGRDLQLLSDEQTNESELIDNEISVHLQTSLDPAKLVLDIIQNPIVPQNREGNEGVMIDGSHIFLLEQLMRMSPRIEPHVREEAMKLALDLKANMRANTENSLVVLGFLLLLSVYGLVSYFNEDEVLKLFEFAAQHKQAVSLFRTLGFVDKISDFVQNLVQNQQHIEAVRFICAYKLAYKIQPVDLLRQHMLKAKLISKRICRKKKSIEKKVMGRDKEIASLETILQCISDNNLESQDLVNEIQDRILVLEQIKENIVLSASEPSSKVAITWPANEAVTKNQVKKVEQPGEKKPANEAVTKNQVKVQQPGRKRPANEALSKNQVQQDGNKKPANVAVTNNQVKVQQPKEKKHANEAVTKNQVQQPGEKKPASEAVTTNQVRVQQPQKKKRAIEAAPNDHQVQQWGNNSKRPRTAVPSVFPPQHNPVFMPGNERGIIPRPSGIPAQFRPPPNYGFPNPIGAEWRGNTGTNYFGNSRPYPPFR
ncbi:COP1-interactive protein 1-like [Gastrolobium bilobum]|uniref:COP1-interactive protein 1-like n=1 Tax=Gastrolobium bilobum TaxID=150636 RepID=UPI002AB30A8C|nr:COP1-interactive protein 1-like [Gastrolobium bilobum]